MVEEPRGLTDESAAALLSSLDETVAAGGTLIDQVELAPTGVERLIASYDPLSRTVRINTLHPFFANFIEDAGSHQPFELLAVAEILTEAYLIEENVDAERARRILLRRDAFLRELVAARREGPAAIAQNLRDQVADERGLEGALADAFRSLGFQVSPIGGNGKPDGIAKATLGSSSFEAGSPRDDYSITYDAKSTGGKSVATHTVGVSTLARHRADYRAQFAVVVAVGFEGADDRDSPLGKECTQHSVTPIIADDLALLVQIAAVRQVGSGGCASCSKRVEHRAKAPPGSGVCLRNPTIFLQSRRFSDTIYELQEEGDDPVEIPAVVALMRDRHGTRLNRLQVEELVNSLRSLAPGYITVNGSVVALEMSVEKVKAEIAKHHRQISPEVIERSYLKPFLQGAADEGAQPSTGRGRGRRRASKTDE